MRSIARSTVASVLLVAYLLMSMAGATHDASHSASHAHISRTSGPVLHAGLHTPAAKAQQGAQSASIEPGDGFCFFCAHSTVMLRAEGLTVPFQSNVYRPYPATFLPSHYVLPPTLAVLSLRAPPATA